MQVTNTDFTLEKHLKIFFYIGGHHIEVNGIILSIRVKAHLSISLVEGYKYNPYVLWDCFYNIL